MEGLVISDVLKDLITNIINIVLLFLIVRILAYKPVKKFLDARKERIAKEFSEAADLKKEAEEKKEEYTRLEEESRAKSSEMLSEAERNAKKAADEIIEAAKENAAQINAKARENAKKEYDAQLTSAKDDITEIAFDISKQVLAREVTDEDNKRIADAFFEKYNTAE